MVGLPARGKSFIGKKLERFLYWRGEEVKIFNVGDRRRKVANPMGSGTRHDAGFFGANNRTLREEIAHGVLYEMIHWLRSGQEPGAAVSPGGTTPYYLAAPRDGTTSPGAGGRGPVSPVDLSDSSSLRSVHPTGAFAKSSPPSQRPALSRSSEYSEEDVFVRESPPPKRPSRTAIFDATNSSVERRRAVTNTLAKELPGCRVVFVESICDDASVLERNLAQKIAMSPDYQGMEHERALADLRERILKYESQYESLSVKERLSFIKLFNLSSQLHLNLIYGTVAKSLVPFMMGIHIGRRPIWLVRAAHCVGTPDALGDSGEAAGTAATGGSKTVIVARSAGLSEEGQRFAQRLGRFCTRRCAEFARQDQEHTEDERPMPTIVEGVASLSLPSDEGGADGSGGSSSHGADAGGAHPRSVSGEWSAVLDDPLPSGCAVFTSTLPRAIQTANCVETGAIPPNASSALNPIDRGTAYGLTEDQFAEQQPEAFARWSSDVRHERFPGGESYADLLSRIEPLLIELEQQTSPVLVVSHLSTLQALASYFTGASLNAALSTSIPHHTVLQLRPASQKMMWEQELIPLNCDADEIAAHSRELL